MSNICKAFLIEDDSTSEYLVNTKNLSAFLQKHKSVMEVVVTGPNHRLFVLSMKNGIITYCSDEDMKGQLVKQMNEISEQEPQMYLYKVTVNARHFDDILVFADSRWQALKDFSQWSLITPAMIKLA